MWSKYVPNNVLSDSKLPVPAFATVVQQSIYGKFTVKIRFPIGRFILPLMSLIDKCHILVKFEQNRMIGNVQNFELLGKRFDAILEHVLVT